MSEDTGISLNVPGTPGRDDPHEGGPHEGAPREGLPIIPIAGEPPITFDGPRTYSQKRGHPRLCMRPVTYAVTPDMRDRWMRHMLAAMDTLELPESHDAAMRDYFRRAADTMINADEDGQRL